MALVNVFASKTLKWNYDECVMRTFRVEGVYKPSLPNITNPFIFIVNVIGCNVEDVCRKIRERGYARSITKIQVFNAPLYITDPPTENPYDLSDATPSLDSCDECCALLVTDDHVQNIKITAYAMLAFTPYQMTGSVAISSDSRSRWGVVRSGSGGLAISSQFDAQSSHHQFAATGTIEISSDFGAITSHYFAEASGGLVVSSDFRMQSSHFEHEASGELNIMGGTVVGWGAGSLASGGVAISSDVVTQLGTANFVAPATGIIVVSSDSTTMTEHYFVSGSGVIEVLGETTVGFNFYHHQMNGSLVISGGARLGFLHTGSGVVAIGGGTTTNLALSHTGSGVIVVKSQFDSISVSYYHAASGVIVVSGQTLTSNSDLGTVNVFVGVDDEGEELGVNFSSVPAPQLEAIRTLVAQTDCCETKITDLCTLKHNLENILPLQRFLLRNGLSLPGSKTGAILSLQYSTRFNSWRSNIHLSGLAIVTSGSETWDFSFEMYCSPDSAWTVAMNIRRVNSSGDSIVRMIALFDGGVFCPSSEQFSSFEFSINVHLPAFE